MKIKVDPTPGPSDKTHCLLIDGKFCLIDEKNAEWICQYQWHLNRFWGNVYAVREIITNGKKFLVPMHRQIMHTKKHQVVHHINHCTLDNREENLLNMNRDEHTNIHKFF